MEALIAYGHPPAAAWSYTPRQLVGWLYFAEQRKRREAADDLWIHFHAARARESDVKRRLRELSR